MRTLTSLNIRSRPALSMRTDTVSQSVMPRPRASSGLMWMWRRAQITPADIVTRPRGPSSVMPGVLARSPEMRTGASMPSTNSSLREISTWSCARGGPMSRT